ncbi:hypothetical protein Tco_0991631 [Tanacetum coccineum]|uniref:Reverse transcriptase domain-containing protein n=1 Tax=Tanacetum coccineum TaxID=301880 RepID=A0ABQ5F1J5_9ASTR
MICGLFQNQASTSGTLPSNTIPNPKGEMKVITTRSGAAYEGPSIPTNPYPKKVVERETEETTDKEQTNFQGSTAQICDTPVTHRLDTDITLQSRSGQVEVSNRGLKRILERTVGEKKTYLMRVITRKLQLNELNELRDQAYENSLIYKERTKKLHDSKIKNRIFNVGDRVLLFNSHLKDIIREA